VASISVEVDPIDGDGPRISLKKHLWQSYLEESVLERVFLLGIFEELYAEWKYESLDGIIPIIAGRLGEGRVEVFGLCILMSGQSLAPIHLRLQLASAVDEVSWLECKLGEKSENSMLRTPYNDLNKASHRLHSLLGKLAAIKWFYSVTFGESQP